MMTCLWLICTSLAIIGSAYAGFAALLLKQFFAKAPSEEPNDAPSVTMLKPLCGAEPGLEANLLTFCNQTYSGHVQILLAFRIRPILLRE